MSDKLETPQGECRDGFLAADRDNVLNLDFEQIRRLSIPPQTGAHFENGNKDVHDSNMPPENSNTASSAGGMGGNGGAFQPEDDPRCHHLSCSSRSHAIGVEMPDGSPTHRR